MNQKSKRPILLAEDSDKDAILIIESLRQSNIRNPIDRVKDGEEVLNYLRREGKYVDRQPHVPLVVFLDIKMPKKDGIETLREIRTDPKLATLPIVIFTSSREEQDLIDSYKTGTNCYVVKPADFSQFADELKQVGVFWTAINEAPPESLFS